MAGSPGCKRSSNDHAGILTGNMVALPGSIPPRNVPASGTPQDVKRVTTELVNSLSTLF
jgi:hypothetical protein